MVGGGSEEGKLRALARELRLEHVHFAGRVNPDDIAGYYASHDVYIQSPNIDNMPVSVLEAYASGLPVVSTDVGGIPAILSDECHGLLAPADDDQALGRQVLRLFDEPGLADRLTKNAFATCETYTWESIRTQWLNIYRTRCDEN